MNYKTFFKKNRFIISLLLIISILRVPSFFEPYWYGDEGVYLSLGIALRKGFLLYRDIFDNKPPLIYLLAALANGRLFWFRLFLALFNLTTIWFFYHLTSRFKLNEKSAKIATSLFALLTTIPLVEGNIANAEIFLLLPTILSLYLLSPYFFSEKEKTFSKLSMFGVGIIFGLGLLFKVPAVFDLGTVIVFLVFFQKNNRVFNFNFKQIFLILGYLLPISIVALFFIFRHAFGNFFSSCFLQTMGYLTSWETGSHVFSFASLLKSKLILNTLIAILLLLCLWWQRKKFPSELKFLAIWFIFSLLSATLSGRPYAHYLIPIIPSLSLLIGLFFQKQEKSPSLIFWLSFFLLLLTCVRYRFWFYPTFSYYRNFVTFILQGKDQKNYFSFFGASVPEIYEVAEFTAAVTNPQDKIFVWADEPNLYPLSRRLPACPYVVAYHIMERNLYNQVGQQLWSSPPALIIVNTHLKIFPALSSILSEYFQIYSSNNFVIFKKGNF